MSDGAAVLLKKQLMKLVHKTEITYGHIICLKLSSILLAAHSNVLYTVARVQPVISLHYNIKFRSCHIGQSDHCLLDAFEGDGVMPIIMFGDMNAHTGHLWSKLDTDSISALMGHWSDIWFTVVWGPPITVQQTFSDGSRRCVLVLKFAY